MIVVRMPWFVALAVGHATVMDVVVIMRVALVNITLPLFEFQVSCLQYLSVFATILPFINRKYY